MTWEWVTYGLVMAAASFLAIWAVLLLPGVWRDFRAWVAGEDDGDTL